MTEKNILYLTPEQVAERLQVNKVTVYRLCRSGKLPAKKIGKTWRISEKILNEFMEPNN
jgi:excisionase family DNA binding protein